MLFGRRPREKEEHAFVRLIIIIPFPFVVVACVFYRLCDALTVREFYERECVHIRASLYIGDLPFLFVFGARVGSGRGSIGLSWERIASLGHSRCTVVVEFCQIFSKNVVSITSLMFQSQGRGFARISHTLLLYSLVVVFAQ